MKRYLLAIHIGMALGLVVTNVQAGTLWCVHDDVLNDSQFCKTTPFPFPVVIPVGPVYTDCDIEALDMLKEKNGNKKIERLYAASGDETSKKGHLYQIDMLGNATDLGKVAGFDEIDGISFDKDGNLWGWDQNQGLFTIDKGKIPSQGKEIKDCLTSVAVPTIKANSIIKVDQPMEMEDIEWNLKGDVLYGVENVHNKHNVDGGHGDVEDKWPEAAFKYDFERGIKLWAYYANSGTLKEICSDITPVIQEIFEGKEVKKKAEIEGLEVLPKEILADPSVVKGNDLLVVGLHGPQQLRYLLIAPPSGQNPKCEYLWKDEIESPNLNDIEGLAYSEIESCGNGQRMTGGGNLVESDFRVTHGFELHCDANALPNNLQINWDKNRFHLKKLTQANCSDDPNLDEEQPVAGFDTFDGEGEGLFNNQPATIKFILTDDGEPGKKDRAKIEIKDKNGNVVLSVDGLLKGGNHQAHGNEPACNDSNDSGGNGGGNGNDDDNGNGKR